MQEKIDLEKYVEDSKIEETETAEEVVKENEFSKFEAWAEAVETGELRIDDLKTDMDEMGYLSGTPLDLEDGYSFFQGYGIEDPDLEEKIDAAKEFPEEFNNDAVEVFKLWAMENNKTDLLDQLGIEYENPEASPEELAVAPETPPAAQAPAQPQAPVAETDKNIKHTFETTINEIVMQHFNLDNENAHPFISDEKIIIEVGKSIKEKLEELGIQDDEKLERAQAYAENLARSKMEECVRMWESKHSKSVNEFNPQENQDPLARLKELAGSLRQKFEQKLTDELDTGELEKNPALEKPAFLRKSEQPGKDAAAAANAQRNQQAGVNVWKNPRDTQGSRGESAEVDEVQQRNFNPHNDLAGRGRLSSLHKTDTGRTAHSDSETARLKDKMRTAQATGGLAGPKGNLPRESGEMETILKLSGMRK